MIDSEVRLMVNDAYDRAKAIITQYRDKLDAVAAKLLEVETITRDEFEAIFPPPYPKKSGTPAPIPA
jgi:cell division protease FtsH